MQEILSFIEEVRDQEVLTQLITQINKSYERLRPELESIHLLLPKYDQQERERLLDYCRVQLLLEEFE